MPPRFAYWTILIDQKATAFRARDREELLPTLHQLRRTNKDVVLKWFARGRLWDTLEQERWARTSLPSPKEKRDAGWRPGGAHRDPRDRFRRPAKTGAGRRARPEKAPGAPQSARPGPERRRDRPWRDRPQGSAPGAGRPPSGRPQGAGAGSGRKPERQDGSPAPGANKAGFKASRPGETRHKSSWDFRREKERHSERQQGGRNERPPIPARPAGRREPESTSKPGAGTAPEVHPPAQQSGSKPDSPERG
jgi:hypothetical protein